jgi:hypothetical protein
MVRNLHGERLASAAIVQAGRGINVHVLNDWRLRL